MKYLITGARGFVGRALIRHLSKLNVEVIGIVRPGSSESGAGTGPKNVEFLEMDLRRVEQKVLPSNVDAVITLGQSSRFREFPQCSDDIFEVNVEANFRLFDWAAKAKVPKFVHVSSGGIYGGKLGAVLDEHQALSVNSPLGFYLGSKLCSEVIFQNYRDLFQTAVILRPFFIYGPFQQKHMFVRRIVDAVIEQKAIFLQGKDGLRTNPVYVEDMVKVLLGSLTLDGPVILNVGGPDTLTLRRLAEIVGEKVGKPPVFIGAEGEPVDHVGDVALCDSLIKRELTSFERGIEETLRSEGLIL